MYTLTEEQERIMAAVDAAYIGQEDGAFLFAADKLTEYEKKCAAAIYGQPQSDGTEYKVKFV